jgi:predicted component of type VI protein secretion system
MNRKIFLAFFVFSSAMTGCVSVKPWQKQFLSDPEMSLSPDAGTNYDRNVENIREGAILPGGSKASGGCGCN